MSTRTILLADQGGPTDAQSMPVHMLPHPCSSNGDTLLFNSPEKKATNNREDTLVLAPASYAPCIHPT